MSTITLYSLESDLVAWSDALERAESEGTPEQVEVIKIQIAEYLTAAVEKRDNFCHFLDHLEMQLHMAKLEAIRLGERRKKIERLQDKLEGYALNTMHMAGVKRLEGLTTTMKAVANPASVEILNEDLIPSKFKYAKITFPLDVWNGHISRYRELREMLADQLYEPIEFPPYVDMIPKEITVSKADIAKEIKAGREVPGADLKTGAQRLVRE